MSTTTPSSRFSDPLHPTAAPQPPAPPGDFPSTDDDSPPSPPPRGPLSYVAIVDDELRLYIRDERADRDRHADCADPDGRADFFTDWAVFPEWRELDTAVLRPGR